MIGSMFAGYSGLEMGVAQAAAAALTHLLNRA